MKLQQLRGILNGDGRQSLQSILGAQNGGVVGALYGDDLGDDVGALLGRLLGQDGGSMGGNGSGLGDDDVRGDLDGDDLGALLGALLGKKKAKVSPARQIFTEREIKHLRAVFNSLDEAENRNKHDIPKNFINDLEGLLARRQNVRSGSGIVQRIPGVPATSQGAGLLGFSPVEFTAASPSTVQSMIANPQVPGHLGRLIMNQGNITAVPGTVLGPIVIRSIKVGNRQVLASGQPVPIEMFAANSTHAMLESVPFGPGTTVELEVEALALPAGIDKIKLSAGCYIPTIIG